MVAFVGDAIPLHFYIVGVRERQHHQPTVLVSLGQFLQPVKVTALTQLAELLCGFVIHVNFLRRQPLVLVGGEALNASLFESTTFFHNRESVFIAVCQSFHHSTSFGGSGNGIHAMSSSRSFHLLSLQNPASCP